MQSAHDLWRMTLHPHPIGLHNLRVNSPANLNMAGKEQYISATNHGLGMDANLHSLHTPQDQQDQKQSGRPNSNAYA
jgi:hypothetical protein